MSKFNDDTRENVQNDFAYLEVPGEDDFAAFIQAIADGIEYHEHVQWGGPGSGTGDASLLIPNLGPDGNLPDEAQGPGGTLSDKAVDNIDTWKKLLPSHPHLAAEAAPLMWEGLLRQARAQAIAYNGSYVYVGLNKTPTLIFKLDALTLTVVDLFVGGPTDRGAEALTVLGDYLYAGLDNSQTTVLKIAKDTMQEESRWLGSSGSRNISDITNDGTYLYLCCYQSDSHIYKLNPETWEIVWMLVGLCGDYQHACYSSCLLYYDNILYIGFDDSFAGYVGVDANTGAQVVEIVGWPWGGHCVALATDGEYIYQGLNVAFALNRQGPRLIGWRAGFAPRKPGPQIKGRPN